MPLSSWNSLKKEDVISGRIGDLFKQGTRRIREDNSSFVFMRDTYEIMFKHIEPPHILESFKEKKGFLKINILPGYRENNIY